MKKYNFMKKNNFVYFCLLLVVSMAIITFSSCSKDDDIEKAPLSEFKTLFEYGKVTNEWITVNGVYGKKFTDVVSGDSIFLPASGCRFFSDGTLAGTGSNGFFWSNTLHESNESAIYYLNLIGSDAATTFASGRSDGYSIRCVAE